MKIAQIAPIIERVPPERYGGTERVIYNLTEELVKKGHDVTLFASGDSITSAKLIALVPKPLRKTKIKDLYGTNTWSLLNIGLAYQLQDKFDIIHDHHYEISAPTANMSEIPVVMTLHGAINENNKAMLEYLDNINYVTISNAQAKPAPKLNWIGTVYNGLDMENYPFSDKAGKYLLFVGRLTMEKGVHTAIDVAWRLQMPLIIAAKLDKVPSDQRYYKEYIEPRLKKYKGLIRWIGEVDEKKRNHLMKNAFAFLHPITWPEPFGLTLIESMACGTPVIAFPLGSIPEIIVNNKTGFIVNTPSQMAAAVKKIPSINRKDCREYALRKFSAKRMADEYEKVYEFVLSLYKEEKIYEHARDQFIAAEIVRESVTYAHDVSLPRSRVKKSSS